MIEEYIKQYWVPASKQDLCRELYSIIDDAKTSALVCNKFNEDNIKFAIKTFKEKAEQGITFSNPGKTINKLLDYYGYILSQQQNKGDVITKEHFDLLLDATDEIILKNKYGEVTLLRDKITGELFHNKFLKL